MLIPFVCINDSSESDDILKARLGDGLLDFWPSAMKNPRISHALSPNTDPEAGMCCERQMAFMCR